MGLRDKYAAAIEAAKGVGMQGSAQEKDGKLHFTGTVRSQDEANRIWNQIKTVADWQTDVIADIKVQAGPTKAAGTDGSVKTYTVQSGDTLSKIAKTHLGNANAYMEIFNANRDQLKDPDEIKPGQVLKIPAMSER
jgi:nucleoid-associated protein YgaU